MDTRIAAFTPHLSSQLKTMKEVGMREAGLVTKAFLSRPNWVVRPVSKRTKHVQLLLAQRQDYPIYLLTTAREHLADPCLSG